MTGQPPPQDVCDEMVALVAASLRRDISVEQRSRLEELVCLDIHACDLYLNLVFESDALIAWAKGSETSETQLGRPLCDSQHDKVIHSESSGDAPHEAELPAMPVLFDNAGSETSGSVFSGWPVAYLVATVIFGIGLVVGAFTYVSHPGNSVVSGQRPVVSEPNSQSLIPNPSPKAPSVGRITGMVDCVLNNDECRMLNAELRTQETGIHHSSFITQHSLVSLGDTFALRSGLLEITYDSGAKVILQGPVTYEVESPAGGYLSLGKLTAKLEKGLPSPVHGRGAGGEGRLNRGGIHHSSFSTQHLFSVRTPTAVVTDLGTEFGVEVTRDGLCEVRVFQGVVETVACRDGKAVGRPQRVLEGLSARISRDRNDSPVAEIAVCSNQAGSKRFVRQMPAPLTNRLHYVDQMGPFGTCIVGGHDLINVGQPTLATIELTSGVAGWESSIARLNDGAIYAKSDKYYNDKQITEATFNPLDGAVVTVTLNTQLHPHGYDIQSIASLTGSGGRIEVQDRSSQKYDIAYSTVAAPETFIALRGDKNATVDCSARGMQELWIKVSSGRKDVPIASEVSKLRFTFHNTDSSTPESMYREIDVFGMPTAEKRGTGRQN